MAPEMQEKSTAVPIWQDASDKEAPPKQPSAFKAYMRIFAYTRPIDKLLLAVGFLGGIGSGVALAMINLIMGKFISVMQSLMSDNPPANVMSEIGKNALYFVYVGIARLGFTYIYSSLLTYVAYHITRHLRYEYLRAALRQEVGYFDGGSLGSVSMQATVNGRLIQSGIAEKLGQVFQAVATFVAAFIIAFISQWKLTLILSCMLPTLFLVVGVTGTIDAGIEAGMLKTYAQAASFSEVALSSIRTIHAFGLEGTLMKKYSTFIDNAHAIGMKRNYLYAIMFAAEYFIIYAGMGLAFWQGITMIARGEVEDFGTIFTVLFSVIIAASTLTALAPNLVNFGRAATAASEFFTLIDRKSTIDPLDKGGDMLASLEGTIDISNLTFSYPTRPNVTVLENFSLSIPAGKVTALVGASGSGKSTIVGLIERWYSPNSGKIQLDGRSIDELNVHWLRTHVRLVQQEPLLFNGTVLENICHGLVGTEWEFGSMEQKREKAQEAAKTAFAHDFIQDLPQQYDTRVGERGGLLSGGQKQRIAIARSIISNPRILLLDEATSALDPYAEGIVQKALDAASQNRTTIVIAHKLRTVRDAHNIVVMRQGKIVEQGKHDELVANGGAYSTLVKAQDLSTAKTNGSQDDVSVGTDDHGVKRIETLGRMQTFEADRLTEKHSHQDYEAYEKSGLISMILKLVATTPELREWYVAIIVTSALASGIFPGQGFLLGKVMDIFKSENIQKEGNFIALMFFVMSLGIMVVYGILGWCTNVVSQALSLKVRRELLQGFLRQDVAFFDRPENTTGSLTSKIDSYAQSIFELMGFSICLVIVAFLSVIVCGIISVIVSWKLGLVGVLAGMPPIVLAGYARIRLETSMDTKSDAKFSASAAIASESVTAIRTISSLALEEDVLRRYAVQLDLAVKESTRPLFNIMIWYSFTQCVEYFILALGFWWGAKLLYQREITMYQFFVSFMTTFFAGQSSGQIFGFSSSFTKATASANYFFWMRQLVPNVRETDGNHNKRPWKDCDSYNFQNVEFAYPLAPKHRVLKGISLKVEPGQFVAFVGASGCGKSTMIALLERYYDPTSGSIVIDEHDTLESLNPVEYRKHISLVQQEPTLFPGSIRENIAMGSVHDNTAEGLQIDDKIIEAACRAANAWDFVSSLPGGLATACGTSGSQLSGGQKQRIAIARALIRNPRVILLDEATSALDTESERIVQAALMEAAASSAQITVAVAHRLSTIRFADQIFVFFGGRIAESGTHDELIMQGGIYKDMCEAQSLDATV